MKKLNENIKLGIFEGVSALLAILSLVFTFLPAYFEDGRSDMSIINIMMGDERISSSPLLIFGFVLLVLGIVVTIILTILHFLNKSNELITTILGIASVVLVLAGGIILTCAVFIQGLDKLNSELGLVQGSWGFKIGNFLVPIFALVSVGFSYPSALIIPHHKDVAEKQK